MIKPIEPIKSQLDIARLLEEEEFETGIEIGVQAGVFAEHNLKHWPNCRQYILVDIWKQQENYEDLANVNNAAQDALYEQTLKRLAPWRNKLRARRMFSTKAAAILRGENVQVDFVYVDARMIIVGVRR
ncbi:hypothetical protein HDV00_004740 [Rhizophlyctis rosea]|nr:hypothetical protein HDV00_004740 [Rhizophlyctis rosea]